MSRRKLTTLYFAYGSNMDGAQMARRCPASSLVGRAELRGFALAFGGWSASWAGGVATVVAAGDGAVQGVLYRLGKGDLARLDGFEGHPVVYGRDEVVVHLPSGERVRALTYGLKDAPAAAPSNRYLGKIARAYARHRLNTEGLVMAINAAPEQSYRVFVYGTLREGEANQHVADLAGARRVGFAELPGYAMHYFAGGAFPAIALGTGSVVGEVIVVDEEGLHKLDQLESEGRLYDREIVELEDGSFAYAYVMEPERLARYPRVRGGDWKARGTIKARQGAA